MKNLIIAVAILALFAGMAVARGPQEATPVPYTGEQSRQGTIAWLDDIETGAPGWTHGDDSAQPTYWHIDTYMAYSGSSWWCGTFAYDADGGYGNSWTQYLTSPYVDWTGYTYPVLFYFFRNDTEIGYDFSFAEAESLGSFVALNRGYDGVMPWGQAGYYIGNHDNPAKVRFAFYSDAAWSDGDGYYQSVGGAFAVDDIEIVDYTTSTQLFYDDADGNVFMTPNVPPAAGDFWSIRSDLCHAYSGTHYWACTSPDTLNVPPNLQNWLKTPVIDITSFDPVAPCTMYFVHQMFMSGAYGGSWQEWGSNDGGMNWVRTGWWFGDQCEYGYALCGDFFLGTIPISWSGHTGTQMVQGKIVMLTDAFGNGPSPYCNGAGVPVDDTWVEVFEGSPVEESSWGKIKSMYR